MIGTRACTPPNDAVSVEVEKVGGRKMCIMKSAESIKGFFWNNLKLCMPLGVSVPITSLRNTRTHKKEEPAQGISQVQYKGNINADSFKTIVRDGVTSVKCAALRDQKRKKLK